MEWEVTKRASVDIVSLYQHFTYTIGVQNTLVLLSLISAAVALAFAARTLRGVRFGALATGLGALIAAILLSTPAGMLATNFQRHQGQVLFYRESASDIVQSVCREVLQNMERFRHPSEAAFKRWLFKTAVRKIAHRREYYGAAKRDATQI